MNHFPFHEIARELAENWGREASSIKEAAGVVGLMAILSFQVGFKFVSGLAGRFGSPRRFGWSAAGRGNIGPYI